MLAEAKRAEAKRADALARQEVSHLVAALEGAEERAHALEQSKASLTSQVQQLTEQLRDCQATRIYRCEDERRRLCRRSTALSRTLPPGPAQAAVTERNLLAAKLAVQEAVGDLDRACGKRDSLALQLTLKSRSLRLLEKRCRAQDRELAQLRRDSGTRCVREAELKAANRACHAQSGVLEQKVAQLAADLFSARCNHDETQQRMRHSVQACENVQARHQQLQAAQELELKLDWMAGSHAAQLHGFISYSEHVRLLEARLAAQAAEASAHLHSQLSRAQAEAEADEAHRAECRRLVRRHEEAEEVVRSLQDLVQELHVKNDVCQQDLQNAKELAQRHREQLSCCQHAHEMQLHQKAMEIATLEQRAAEAEDRSIQLAQEVQGLTVRCIEGKSKAAAMVSELAEAKADAKACRLQIAKVAEEAMAQAARVRQLEEEEQKCARDLAAASQAALQALEGRLAQVDTQGKASQERAAALEKENMAQAARIKQLGAELQEARSALAIAQQNASACGQALHSELSSAKLEARSGQLTVQTLQAGLALLTSSREQLTEQAKAAARDQQGLAALAEGLKVEVATLQQELARAQAGAAKGRQELSAVEEEAAQLREGLEQAKTASSKASVRSGALQSRVKELESQASSLIDRLADTENRARAQLDAARVEVTEAGRVQAELRQKLACKEKESDAREEALKIKVRATVEEMEDLASSMKAERSVAKQQADAALQDVRSQTQADMSSLRASLGEVSQQLAQQRAESAQLLITSQHQESSIQSHNTELELFKQQHDAGRQALAACEGHAQCARHALHSLVDCLQQELHLPVEQQQALCSLDAAEQAAAISQVSTALRQHAERWVTENILIPLEQCVGSISVVPPLRKSFPALTISARLEHLLECVAATGAELVQREADTQQTAEKQHHDVSPLNRLRAALEEIRRQGASLAEEARNSALAPLRSELASIRASVIESKAAYAADVAAILAAAQSEQRTLQDSMYELEVRLRREADRSERLNIDLVRIKGQAAVSGKTHGQRPELQPSHVNDLLSELEYLEGRQ